jgi:DnaJ-domain-containing protein 1
MTPTNIFLMVSAVLMLAAFFWWGAATSFGKDGLFETMGCLPGSFLLLILGWIAYMAYVAEAFTFANIFFIISGALMLAAFFWWGAATSFGEYRLLDGFGCLPGAFLLLILGWIGYTYHQKLLEGGTATLVVLAASGAFTAVLFSIAVKRNKAEQEAEKKKKSGKRERQRTSSTSNRKNAGNERGDSDQSENDTFAALDCDFISMGVILAKCDGDQSSNAKAHFLAVLSCVMGVDIPEEIRLPLTQSLFSKQEGEQAFVDYARNFRKRCGSENIVAKTVLTFLFAIASVDGEISPAKEHLLRKAIEILETECREYNDYLAKRKQGSAKNSQPVSEEKRCAKILGLSGKVTVQQVKQAYRDQVKQYHPDRVAHLGPKLKAVADQEMKDLNEAYAYLKNKYGF